MEDKTRDILVAVVVVSVLIALILHYSASSELEDSDPSGMSDNDGDSSDDDGDSSDDDDDDDDSSDVDADEGSVFSQIQRMLNGGDGANAGN